MQSLGRIRLPEPARVARHQYRILSDHPSCVRPKYQSYSTASICNDTAGPPQYVKIVEVGPRDGLQNEEKAVAAADKIRFVKMLAEAGCPAVEVTSFVSHEWVPALADAAEVMSEIALWKKSMAHLAAEAPATEFSVLTPNLKFFNAALRAGADEVAIFGSASEAFSIKNINCSVDDSIDRFREVLSAAKQNDIPVRGYVSCVLGCPYQGHVPPSAVARLSDQLAEMGCREISLGDTIGVGTPEQTVGMLREVQSAVDISVLAVHFHDTYGQALANIYAAVKEGISIVDSSAAGLGGCPYASGASGNVATEDLVYMLHGMGIETGIDMEKLIDASDFICKVLDQPTKSKAALAISSAMKRSS